MKKLTSPLTYYGGKANIADWIIDKFPENYQSLHYVEPFAGGLSVLFTKKKSNMESINDLDENISNFWTVLRDPELSKLLMDKLAFHLHSEAEYERCRDTFKDIKDPLDKAYRFWVSNQLAFASVLGGGFAYQKAAYKAKSARKNVNKIKIMKHIHERIKEVQVFCRDATQVIQMLDDKNTLFYLDPPYPETDQRPYDGKFDKSGFNALLSCLVGIKGLFAMSFYMQDWMSFPKQFNVFFKKTRSSVITRQYHLDTVDYAREECLVTNYELPKYKQQMSFL